MTQSLQENACVFVGRFVCACIFLKPPDFFFKFSFIFLSVNKFPKKVCSCKARLDMLLWLDGILIDVDVL